MNDEKFSNDLSFMTEEDWQRRKENDKEKWLRMEAEKAELRKTLGS